MHSCFRIKNQTHQWTDRKYRMKWRHFGIRNHSKKEHGANKKTNFDIRSVYKGRILLHTCNSISEIEVKIRLFLCNMHICCECASQTVLSQKNNRTRAADIYCLSGCERAFWELIYPSCCSKKCVDVSICRRISRSICNLALAHPW